MKILDTNGRFMAQLELICRNWRDGNLSDYEAISRVKDWYSDMEDADPDVEYLKRREREG